MQHLFINVHVSQYLQTRSRSCKTSKHKNGVVKMVFTYKNDLNNYKMCSGFITITCIVASFSKNMFNSMSVSVVVQIRP